MSNRFWAPASAVMLALSVVTCGAEPSSTTNPEPPTTASMATTSTSSAVTTSTTSTTTTPTTTAVDGPVEIEIEVEGGEVSGGGRIAVELGANVRLQVSADIADVIHLHGYDLSAPVSAGTPGLIEFTADIPGIFEVELEESGLIVGELEVAA